MSGQAENLRKILIGSNGGLTGVYLAKRLQKTQNLLIYGSDSSQDHVGRFFVQKQFQLPNSSDPGFLDALIALLNRYEIDAYLPTHSAEVRTVSLHEKEMKSATRTKFLVCPIETFRALEDKAEANRNLKKAGIPVPELIEGAYHEYPIFMKRRMGSGSAGSAVIENRRIHEAYKETVGNVAFFQLIKGEEYTLDCLYDAHGTLLGYNQRKRLKTIGGAVSVTQNAPQFDISPWMNIISKTWVFRGCVNFQYIVSNGVPYFIDVNLRYPSGGLPLTVHSGLDIPNFLLNLLIDGNANMPPLRPPDSAMTMYRYFEEIFDYGIS